MEIIIGCIIAWATWELYKFCLNDPRNLKKAYGDSAENLVAGILGKLNDNYQVKHDVRFGRTQVDHYVICGNRIYVIETKRWTGKVSGKKDDDKWRVEYGNEVYYMKSPIKQNEFHIREMEKEYRGYEFVSVVVFVSSGSIPKLKGVVRDDDLINYILECESKAS